MTSNNRLLMYAGIVVAALVLLSVFTYLFYPSFMPWFEQRDSGEQVIEQTYDANNAVEQYEEFRSLYHDIESQRQKIENHYDELDRFYEVYGEDPENWSRTAEEEHNRIQKRITGNQNQLENLVAEYNAMSDMANKEIFKCHLPYQVDESFAIHGQPGSGDAEEPVDVGPDGEPIDGEPVEGEQCDGLPDSINSSNN